MSRALVELQGISKRFNDVTVLSGVDLRLEPEQILTLIGPNGAGKTTLVKIVLGLLKADEGQVSRHPELRIGYMPQKLHIDPTLPVTLGRFLKLAEPAKNQPWRPGSRSTAARTSTLTTSSLKRR